MTSQKRIPYHNNPTSNQHDPTPKTRQSKVMKPLDLQEPHHRPALSPDVPRRARSPLLRLSGSQVKTLASSLITVHKHETLASSPLKIHPPNQCNREYILPRNNRTRHTNRHNKQT